MDDQGIVRRVVHNDALVFTNSACGTFTAYSFNYYDSGDNFPPFVGGYFLPDSCKCCDFYAAEFEVADNQAPVLLNPPGDISLTCYDQLTPMLSIDWIDNCGFAQEAKRQTGVADTCQGGVLLREWTYTDRCDNQATHVQVITIEGTPLPVYDSEPADITVECDQIPSSGEQLFISNPGSGECAITDSVYAIQIGEPDLCGGIYTYYWQYKDFCGRSVDYFQNITVEPVPPASFTITPADTTIRCSDIPSSFPS